MRRPAIVTLLTGVMFCVCLAAAAPATIDPASLLGGSTPAELAGSIRTILLGLLPTPLYQDNKHWGRQKEVPRGVKWKGEGLDFHPELQRNLKNDGLWWRVKVSAPDLDKSLVLEIRDVQKPEPGKMTLAVFISFMTDIEYERQRWDAGTRLFSTSIRGRARVNLTVNCEAIARSEKTSKLFADSVFRLRVTSSNFRYDDVVFEHVAGVGGEAAKLIGDMARANLHLWRPSLEQKLIDKANAAIIKKGDTKEIHIGPDKFFVRKK